MLLRFDPFRELDRLTETAWSNGRGRQSPLVLPMDAYRTGDTFHVHLDLPGVDPSTIDVHVEKNVLTVTAQRQWTPREGEDVVVSERPQGTFSRQLFLGESLDTDNIAARYEHGVLSLTIPVAAAAKPRKVEISVGGDQPAAVEATSTAA